jgi:hypothetical protein
MWFWRRKPCLWFSPQHQPLDVVLFWVWFSLLNKRWIWPAGCCMAGGVTRGCVDGRRSLAVEKDEAQAVVMDDLGFLCHRQSDKHLHQS